MILPNVSALFVLAATLAEAAAPIGFERVVIDAQFPGGYQVEVADVDGDGRPDIVALGGSTIAWYQNPGWTKRRIGAEGQTPGVISSATADLDGDGKAEVAIAVDFEMNEPTRGRLLLAHQGKGPDDPWRIGPIAPIGSIHRLRWLRSGPPAPGGKPGPVTDLVVAPIFGRSARPPRFAEEAAGLIRLPLLEGSRGPTLDPRGIPLASAPVLHAIEVNRLGGELGVLGASNLGVTFTPVGPGTGGRTRALVAGFAGEVPNRGASEIHLGRSGDGRRFLATVEPWHGSEVVVYPSADASPSPGFGPRQVIDATLDEGHALWVADIDGDGQDEVFAGHRGKGARVSAYRLEAGAWNRTVLDPALSAQDLRGGDLDGDGRPEVVAIGGRSHNVVLFRFRPNPGPKP